MLDLVKSAVGMGYNRTMQIATILEKPANEISVTLLQLRKSNLVTHSKKYGWRIRES